MKKTMLFETLNNVDDKYVIECMPQKKRYYRKKDNIKLAKRGLIGVAAAVLMFSLGVNTIAPVWARTLPVVGDAFAFIQDKLDFSGVYANYADKIGASAEDNGISITVSEAYCDGTNLFVSYKIASDKSFDEYADGDYMHNQMDYSITDYIESDNQMISLDDFGVTGLEGEFVNDKTFVGVETYSLKGDSFPDSFDLKLNIDSLRLIQSDVMSKDKINGNWKFSIPITVNHNDIVTLEINEEKNEHTIDKVVVSPIMITIYTSYPDLYSDTVRYEVVAFGDISSEDIAFQGQYGATSGITKISREKVDKYIDVYVIDNSTLEETGIKEYSREQIEKHAIVSKRINLK